MSTKSLEASVRRILLQEWDPIGIRDVPEAQDEYDSYVFEICAMLREGKTTGKLYEHLRWIESERMGLDGDARHTEWIAKMLTSLLM
jgi:hypothetical protein